MNALEKSPGWPSEWLGLEVDTFPPHTLPKTNMDTQNDGLEKVTPLKYLQFLVSMLDFWGVKFDDYFKKQGYLVAGKESLL